MAVILRDHEFATGNDIYPWNRWTNGKIWNAHEDVDYFCSDESFRHSLFRNARIRGLKVRTNFDDNGSIVFQFYRPRRKRK